MSSAISFAVILSLSLYGMFDIAVPAYAHPGNTAADGCHYCRTNCDKWGVEWDERHCHGGYGESSYYSEGSYYGQSNYYTEGSYYNQGTYYSEGSYYNEATYYNEGIYYSEGTYYKESGYSIPVAQSNIAPIESSVPSIESSPEVKATGGFWGFIFKLLGF